MWNNLDIKCPSEDLCEYQPQEQYLAEELHNLVTVLSTAASTLTSEDPLWAELHVLIDIQIKYKQVLNCEKFLAHVHRVAICTKKLVLLNLSRSYLDLAERFLVQFQNTSLMWHLPSRQQLEYLLIRTLSASKLVCQGIKYSREAFCLLLQKLKAGQYILDLVKAASLIARLNVLFRSTVEQLCSMYQKVISWRFKLKSGAYEWPQKLDLPQDLRKWLKSSESESLKPLSVPNISVEALSILLKSKNKPTESTDSDSDSIVCIDEIIEVEDAIVEIPNSPVKGVIKKRKIKKSQELTSEQNQLLHKILQLRSLKALESMWSIIQNFPESHLPKVLRNRKKEVINNLFTQIKAGIPSKKFKKPSFMKNVSFLFCKYLGFTQTEIETCRHDHNVQGTPDCRMTREESPEVSILEVKTPPQHAEPSAGAAGLEPVKTLKGLRQLYNKLCEMQNKDAAKVRKLKKFFKRRRADILLMKESGEKVTAKKLIFCTSKLLLAHYNK